MALEGLRVRPEQVRAHLRREVAPDATPDGVVREDGEQLLVATACAAPGLLGGPASPPWPALPRPLPGPRADVELEARSEVS